MVEKVSYAVLWMAALIRAERENCCDDMALAHTGSKTNYIKALVACEEYKMAVPVYAMGFCGRKDHLLGRVKRMLSNSNTSLNIMERSVLAIGLLTAILVTAAFTNAGKIHTLVTKVKQAASVVVPKKVELKQEVGQTKVEISRPKPEQVGDRESLGKIRQQPSHKLENPSLVNYKTNYKAYQDDTNRMHYKAYDEVANREKLTAALVTEGIIQNRQELQSFKLSDKEFIVNGKKMPDEIYQKFRKVFVPVPENGKQGSWSWLYNYSEQTTNGSAAMNRTNYEQLFGHELILKI